MDENRKNGSDAGGDHLKRDINSDPALPTAAEPGFVEKYHIMREKYIEKSDIVR